MGLTDITKPLDIFKVSQAMALEDYATVSPDLQDTVAAETSRGYSRRLAEAAKSAAEQEAKGQEPVAVPIYTPPPRAAIAHPPILEEDRLARAWTEALKDAGLDPELDAQTSLQLVMQSLHTLRYSTFLQVEATNQQATALQAQLNAVNRQRDALLVQEAALQRMSVAVAGTPAEHLTGVLRDAVLGFRDQQATVASLSEQVGSLRREVEVSAIIGGTGGKGEAAAPKAELESAGPHASIPLPRMKGTVYAPLIQYTTERGSRVKRYACPWSACPRSSQFSGNRASVCSHIRAEHTHEKVRCPFCQDAATLTTSAQSLQRHIADKHPDLGSQRVEAVAEPSAKRPKLEVPSDEDLFDEEENA